MHRKTTIPDKIKSNTPRLKAACHGARAHHRAGHSSGLCNSARRSFLIFLLRSNCVVTCSVSLWHTCPVSKFLVRFRGFQDWGLTWCCAAAACSLKFISKVLPKISLMNYFAVCNIYIPEIIHKSTERDREPHCRASHGHGPWLKPLAHTFPSFTASGPTASAFKEKLPEKH